MAGGSGDRNLTVSTSKETRKLLTGLGFITPSIIGFLVFTLFPLAFSFVMAFTNWDLRMHNMFTDQSVRFVGFENFARLFSERDFSQFFGNTLFLMMGIPFGVAGSLAAAVLLSQPLRGGRGWAWALATLGLIIGVGALAVAGAGTTATVILLTGIAGLILIGGASGGRTVYRTLFYFPHFTAGVATFLLWKKLYSPHTGPVNAVLSPALKAVGDTVGGLPPWLLRGGLWVSVALMALIVWLGARQLRRLWRDGDVGWLSISLGTVFLCLPAALAPAWAPTLVAGIPVAAVAAVAAGLVVRAMLRPRDYACAADEGLGHGIIVCGGLMVVEFILLGLGSVSYHLPAMSAEGLAAPEWLSDFYWAKPSMMIMGLWAAIGSNNMLLYLAGLSNVPTELYEAADIDGASPLQRFWHVTWPQLAPITFLILIMSVIGGLQGGFAMARTMTKGGPAGATTTLSYFVYREGFETGRLGYASAVAWTLFALVFVVTLFNWRFGNRYVND